MSDTVRFLYPQVLYLSIVIPLVFLARWRHLHYLKKIGDKLGFDSPLDRVSKIGSRRRSLLSLILLLLSVTAAVLALTRPQILSNNAQEIIRKLDLVFLLDNSPSMQSEDILPSRLKRAGQLIGEMTTGEEMIGRVGLVTFTGPSLIRSYLTSDIGSLLFYLDFLKDPPVVCCWMKNRTINQNYQNLPKGTNIGSALNSGIQVIESAKENETIERNRPVLVLVSDGEDHGEELRKAINRAALKNLRVYTIGIGSEAGGFIPVLFKDGIVRYLQDSHGTRQISRLDEGTLRRIAETTGGRFYRAYEGSEISTALREIVSLEREIVGYRNQQEWVDVYQPLLLIAAMSLLPAWVLERG